MKNIKVLILAGVVLFFAGLLGFTEENDAVVSESTSPVKESSRILKNVDANFKTIDYGRIKIKKENATRVKGGSVEFYDAKGKFVKQLELGGWDVARISEGRKIIGVQRSEVQAQDLDVFDENGTKIREHKKIRPYEKIDLLNDGSFVVSGYKLTQERAYRGGLAFYNAKGEIVREILFDRLGNNAGALFGNDSRFAFLVNIPKKGVFFQCYASNGEKQWEYPFENVQFFNFTKALSVEKGDVFVKLISNNGKETWRFNQSGLVGKTKGW